MKILIDVLDFGEIEVELYKDIAPVTVDNFIKLVKQDYFNNSSFHRIIKGFMIQGGSSKNDLKHERGVISMARTNVKNSASSQFFIMHQDSPHLDGEYAAFGKVTNGMDVVDSIASVKTSLMDAPLQKVVINNIKLV